MSGIGRRTPAPSTPAPEAVVRRRPASASPPPVDRLPLRGAKLSCRSPVGSLHDSPPPELCSTLITTSALTCRAACWHMAHERPGKRIAVSTATAAHARDAGVSAVRTRSLPLLVGCEGHIELARTIAQLNRLQKSASTRANTFCSSAPRGSAAAGAKQLGAPVKGGPRRRDDRKRGEASVPTWRRQARAVGDRERRVAARGACHR